MTDQAQSVEALLLAEARRQTRAVEGIRAVVTIWMVLTILGGLIAWVVLATS